MRHGLFLLVTLLIAAVSFGQARPGPGETFMVVRVKDRGEVAIRLYTDKAPKTTARVIALVGQGFYNGQRFHKVVTRPKPFLVQVGDPGSRSRPLEEVGGGGTGQRVPYEDTGLPNDEGMVGLSTLPNDRDSGDSQFYVLLGPARFLDGSYTVFGRVVSGMDVVRAIQLGDVVTDVSIVRG